MVDRIVRGAFVTLMFIALIGFIFYISPMELLKGLTLIRG